ncbi:MAG: hypothetical protein LBN97_03665 [Oscillospiraceae bacterium]|jgi:hypothetical protein|nr:hypothetical protein [Oscillospiraceae bacterium]
METQTIQFETTVKDGAIQIPEEYKAMVPDIVKVTLDSPGKVRKAKIISSPPPRTREFTAEDFSAMQIDTRGWKFNREEANIC